MTTLIKSKNGLLLSTKYKKSESLWRDDQSYKLLYSLKGNMYYELRRKSLTMAEDEFVLINPHDEHRQVSVDDHKFLIELNSVFVNQVVSSLTTSNGELCFALAVQKQPQIKQWVSFIYDYVQIKSNSEDASLEIFLDHSFTQLALLLAKTTIGTHTTNISIEPFKQIQPALFQVMSVIKEDIEHSWSLTEMANVLGIGKYQFAHIFKEHIGISPFSWLQIVRIIRSQHLLIYTNQSILEVAISCGFSSISVYNQLFKRLYGFTPSFFRSQYSNHIENGTQNH